MKFPNKIELTLIFFILIGTVLRFWGIGFQQMNWDEMFTMEIAGPAWNLLPMVYHILTYDFTPPFYYIAAHFSMLVFGATAEAIRYPSAIFGVLLIPVMYLLGKEHRDELFGLMLAGFTTIFYNGIFYSKFGRAYSLELLFFAVVFYFFMKSLKGDGAARIWFAVFSVCCLWTHLFSVIPIGIMALWLLWDSGFEVRELGWFGILCIGSLPLLNYVNLVLGRAISYGDFGDPLWSIAFLIPLDIFTFSVFILFPFAVWALWKHRKEQVVTVISVMCITTWVAMMVLSFKTQIILHYALPMTIPLIMMAMVPVYDAIKEKRLGFNHLVVIMVVVILEVVQIVALMTIQRSWIGV